MPRTPPPPLILPGLAFTLALAGCSPTGIDMTNAAPSSDASPAAPGTAQPQYRRNPAPTRAYRITMTIRDAPGAFAWMRPIAHYDVVNRECLSPPKDNPGGRSAPTPTEALDVALEPVGPGVYATTVYADYIQDEDYVGQGVCRWELTGFVVQMKATGAARETLFTPNMFGEDLLAGMTETNYFNKISYPRLESSELEQPLSTGQSDRSRFGPSIRDEDLFTVTFAAVKTSP